MTVFLYLSILFLWIQYLVTRKSYYVGLKRVFRLKFWKFYNTWKIFYARWVANHTKSVTNTKLGKLGGEVGKPTSRSRWQSELFSYLVRKSDKFNILPCESSKIQNSQLASRCIATQKVASTNSIRVFVVVLLKMSVITELRKVSILEFSLNFDSINLWN